MTTKEADNIFKVWQQWFWPFHSLLFSLFQSNIPESFLPYPKDILNEALDIILQRYNQNSKEYEAINITKSAVLSFYENDKDAFDMFLRMFEIPEMINIKSDSIKKFTGDWMNWYRKQSKSN